MTVPWRVESRPLTPDWRPRPIRSNAAVTEHSLTPHNRASSGVNSTTSIRFEQITLVVRLTPPCFYGTTFCADLTSFPMYDITVPQHSPMSEAAHLQEMNSIRSTNKLIDALFASFS